MLENKLIQIPAILGGWVVGRVDGQVGGRVCGRVAGGIEIKAKSVQFQFQLPVGTELGNMINEYLHF